MLKKNGLLAVLAGILLVGGALAGAGFAANDASESGGQSGWGGMFHRGGHGMMRPAMTPEEMDARIRERFARLDRNSDGVIDRAEIESMLSERRTGRMGHGMGRGRWGGGSGGPQVGRADAGPGSGMDRPGKAGGRMLGRFDENRDGKVTKDEFLGFVKKRFAAMDLDNDGKITDADLPPMMRGQDILKGSVGGDGPGRMGRMGHVLQWLRAADANRDGVITLEEVAARADKQFARLDRNGDGSIDQADRDMIRKEMVDYGVLRFLHRHGADKDGKVTREQFAKVAKERMTRMAAEGSGMGYRGERHRGGPGMGMGRDGMGHDRMMGRERPDGPPAPMPSPPERDSKPSAPGAGPDGQRRL